MTFRTVVRGTVAVLAAAILASHPHAQQVQRFIYAALPGVGGGNNMNYGGAGILVFDIDHGHKFVKRIPLQGVVPDGARQEAIKGIAANAETARLYVSTSRRVAAYDLLTDKLVWEQSYESRGTDRIALSPDGKTLYAPELGAPKWMVANAITGAPITTIDKPGNPHNTQFSDDGRFVYFEAEGNTRTMSVVDASTRTIVKEIGPFGNMVRPFTFNGRQTLLFANINDFLGFEVADLKTGQILHHVEVPGVTAGRSPTHGIPSHGIAMTQDESEIWIADNANNYVRIFDATVMPPVMKTSVKVRDEPGWITFGIDYACVSINRRRRRRQVQADRRNASGRTRRQCRKRKAARDRFRRRETRPRRRSIRQRQETLNGVSVRADR